MKTLGIISITIATLLFTTSCDWYPQQTVIGTGDVESMEVNVPPFSGVSVTGHCNVDIQIGDTQQVEFRAQSQILDVLTFEVIHDILEIGFKPGYNVRNSKEISAHIVIPSLFYVAVTGAGDYHLEGARQDLLDIYISGSGNVEAFDMEVEDCMVMISGASQCELNVINSLEVQISGVGNIFYMGHPSLISDISGVGQVTAVNN